MYIQVIIENKKNGLHRLHFENFFLFFRDLRSHARCNARDLRVTLYKLRSFLIERDPHSVFRN